MEVINVKSAIEGLIKEKKRDIDIDSLYGEDSLVSVLNMDSVDFVSFILELEELFRTQFNSAEIYNMDMNLNDLVSILQSEVL